MGLFLKVALPEQIVFPPEDQMREWFYKVLDTGKLLSFPENCSIMGDEPMPSVSGTCNRSSTGVDNVLYIEAVAALTHAIRKQQEPVVNHFISKFI